MTNEITFTPEQLEKIGQAQAKAQAQANILAPYELLKEVESWTPTSQYFFTTKTRDQPMEKKLEIFLEMKGRAEEAVEEAAAEAKEIADKMPEILAGCEIARAERVAKNEAIVAARQEQHEASERRWKEAGNREPFDPNRTRRAWH